MGKLERLREEHAQVQTLLTEGKVRPEPRRILEALAKDLDRQIDEELTNRLLHSSEPGSRVA